MNRLIGAPPAGYIDVDSLQGVLGAIAMRRRKRCRQLAHRSIGSLRKTEVRKQPQGLRKAKRLHLILVAASEIRLVSLDHHPTAARSAFRKYRKSSGAQGIHVSMYRAL